MKRVIKASSFKKIEGYSFTHKLISTINQLNPDDETGFCAYNRSNSIGYAFTVEGVPSLEALEDIVEEALETMGYSSIHDITGYDPDEKVRTDEVQWAVVQNNAWVKLELIYNYYFDSADKEGVVYLGFDNGNVILEDWYED